ncbi:hypothetical protein A2572_01165 [Candidatus Collierbacteria bacterium RIFOXYD1_FULL_40_9]|uniref:AB hydrolase-1 domain-containing protein n=1 Tax=Candidatus Collierbacteria bacterium RIFOXYD1_FULL_40_9 TaxID=1817731 RepID=A0A1F5FP48_9BACT|nr:MAG: hypothetical protein A2572_01165 [Candidatus Collierbacteria bacterium RIFOXYD1_FULL_40_9]
MQVVVNGILTNYVEVNSDNKSVLLILHGWRNSSANWIEVSSKISNVRIIALDMPAFGATAPMGGQPSVAEYADFVNSFILKLGLKNLTLLGHSFGGQVAVDLALRYPKRIEKLILVSPACIRSTKPNFKSQIASKVKPIVKNLPNNLQEYFLRFMASSDYLKSTLEQRQVLNRILKVDYSNLVSDISQKTFIIWGTEDTTIPNSGKFLAEKIKSSTLIPLYGVDHNPQVTAPLKLAKVILKCLED